VAITKEYIGLAREIKTGIEIRNVDGVFSAVWDTGSNCTVISLQLAKELGFEKIGEIIQSTVIRSFSLGAEDEGRTRDLLLAK